MAGHESPPNSTRALPVWSWALPLLAAIGVGVWLYVRFVGPSPEDVCDHFLDVFDREIPDDLASPGQREGTMNTCVDNIDRTRRNMDKDAFEAMANCVLASTSLEAMKACEGWE